MPVKFALVNVAYDKFTPGPIKYPDCIPQPVNVGNIGGFELI